MWSSVAPVNTKRETWMMDVLSFVKNILSYHLQNKLFITYFSKIYGGFINTLYLQWKAITKTLPFRLAYLQWNGDIPDILPFYWKYWQNICEISPTNVGEILPKHKNTHFGSKFLQNIAKGIFCLIMANRNNIVPIVGFSLLGFVKIKEIFAIIENKRFFFKKDLFPH